MHKLFKVTELFGTIRALSNSLQKFLIYFGVRQLIYKHKDNTTQRCLLDTPPLKSIIKMETSRGLQNNETHYR
jgi:hypothetical protein